MACWWTIDSFMHVTPPNMDDPQHVYDPADFDFRLKPTSPAVDAGIELPNITDGFTGKAPDLGAIEAGPAACRITDRATRRRSSNKALLNS